MIKSTKNLITVVPALDQEAWFSLSANEIDHYIHTVDDVIE